MFLPIDVTLHLDRDEVHGLISKCITSREAYTRLYEYMRLPPLPVNMPLLAGIDLWLLTRNPNWSDIARAAYCCGEENVVERVFKREMLCIVLWPIACIHATIGNFKKLDWTNTTAQYPSVSVRTCIKC